MDLLQRVQDRSAQIGIIGLGYVGLPLGLEFAIKGFNVTGFDLDEKKIRNIEAGKSYFKHIKDDKVLAATELGKFSATSEFSKLSGMDAIIICVPTPLDEHREPDLSFIINTANTVAKYLREGQIVILESTTYPGTTEEVLLPLFENVKKRNIVKVADLPEEESDLEEDNHLIIGRDFFLAFSPEREDPNNPEYSTSTIPKVVGGVTAKCSEIATALYNSVIIKTVPVSSARVAEATKLLENIYRSVNIALVNELKMVFERMNIDIWEVIEAASTKPFGFHPFYPGPGLGGHCIPIDPFYLTWKAREHDINTKFIELAGEINTSMPYYVVEKAADALNREKKSINGSKVLIIGAAYKKDIDDMRESPTLKLIEIFREKGAEVEYNDPYVKKLPKTRKYDYLMSSQALSAENLHKYDLVVISTDHSEYDYQLIYDNSKLILDSRNAFARRGITSLKIVKA